MARLNDSSFELNSTTTLHEYTKIGSPTIASTHPRTGTYALNVVNPTAGAAWGGGLVFASSNVNTIYCQFCVYFEALPTGDCTIGALMDSGGTQPMDLWYENATGSIKIKYNNFASTLSGSKVVTTGQYYVFEVFFDRSPAAGSQVITARENGTQFATSSVLTITNGVNELRFGSNLQGDGVATMNLHFDDMVVNDNTGGSENSWVDQQKIKTLRPSAAGDVNTFGTQTGGTAGAGNNYTRVNELPPNDATSFNGSSTLNEEDLFAMNDSGFNSYDNVYCVTGHMRFRNSTADATAVIKMEIEKTASGTKTQSAAITPNTTTWNTNKTAVPRNPVIVAYTDPDGAAWTQTTIDSMQAGYKLTTGPGTAGRRIDVTALWVNVSYKVGTPPASTAHLLSALGAGG